MQKRINGEVTYVNRRYGWVKGHDNRTYYMNCKQWKNQLHVGDSVSFSPKMVKVKKTGKNSYRTAFEAFEVELISA